VLLQLCSELIYYLERLLFSSNCALSDRQAVFDLQEQLVQADFRHFCLWSSFRSAK
jgi:hypothetical protein